MEVKQEPDDIFIEQQNLEIKHFFPNVIIKATLNNEKHNTQISNVIKNELVSIDQENGAVSGSDIDKKTPVIFGEENIVGSINQQELNKDLHTVNVRNYLIGKIRNSIAQIKQEANVYLNTDLTFKKCSTSVKGECNNIDKINPHKIKNTLKILKEKRIKRMKSIDGKHIKKMDPFGGIILCTVCGNMYTKQVHFSCHFLANHFVNQKKLCRTKINKKEINNVERQAIHGTISVNVDVKDEIEIVEHGLENELQETGNCTDQFMDIDNYNPRPDQIVIGDHMCYCCNTDENPPKCVFCSKYFEPRQMKTCAIGRGPFKCEICLKCFTRKDNLNKHLLCHTGEKPFKCEICVKCYTRKDHLTKHLRSHTGEKPFKCEICLKSFSHKSFLITHLQCHTNKKSFKCEICLKICSYKSTLKRHLRCHTDEKSFKCDVCLKCFVQKGHFEAHLRSHTGEKPFKCEICLKCFSEKSNLNKHLRYHTGEKPFECKVCLKSFSQQGHFKAHLRCHTGERPFKCEICLKCFSLKSHLNNHLRSHTAQKIFKCEICLRKFLRKHNLNNHLKCHTGEKPCEFVNTIITNKK